MEAAQEGSTTPTPKDSTWAQRVLAGAMSPTAPSLLSLESHAIWQWEHKSGWKDYDGPTNLLIERAYLRGEAYVRLRSGKENKHVMELFFVDLIQNDPSTGNHRKIRRVGESSCRDRVGRRINEWLTSVETGRPYRMRYKQFVLQRQELLQRFDKEEFELADLCHPTSVSFAARIVLSPAFVIGTMLMIGANCLWLGYETNHNKVGNIWAADLRFQVAENAFCVIFFVELLLRFLAYKRKVYCVQDLWFVFDFVLVVLMVGETWILQPLLFATDDSSDSTSSESMAGDFSVFRMLRLLKLARLSRFGRLLRFCPELLTMLKGIGRAMVSVFFTGMLLTMLLYSFGIIFKTTAEAYPGTLDQTFSTVGESMWYLLLHGTLLDAVAEVVPQIRAESTQLTVYFMLFTFLSHLTLLNMLVGILCEVMADVSRGEKERSAVAAFKQALKPLLEVHDLNGDGALTKKEFELLMQNPETHMILGQLGVNAEDILVLEESLFEEKGMCIATSLDDLEDAIATSVGNIDETTSDESLSHAVFMETALRLRSGNSARVQDIAELRSLITRSIDDLAVQVTNQLELARLDMQRGLNGDIGGAAGDTQGHLPTQASLSSLPSAGLRSSFSRGVPPSLSTLSTLSDQDSAAAALPSKPGVHWAPEQSWQPPNAPMTPGGHSPMTPGGTEIPPHSVVSPQPPMAASSSVETLPQVCAVFPTMHAARRGATEAEAVEDGPLEVERLLLASFQDMRDEFRRLRECLNGFGDTGKFSVASC